MTEDNNSEADWSGPYKNVFFEDTVFWPSSDGHNRVESCPGDIFVGETLIRLTNELDMATGQMFEKIRKFMGFLRDFEEWDADDELTKVLQNMMDRNMEQRRDFVQNILLPVLKKHYGVTRNFRDLTRDAA